MDHNIKHERSQGLIDYAVRFATEKHTAQKRKYTGEPYINHCLEVGELVSNVTNDCESICAAILHDTLEDTDTEKIEIQDCFGWRIMTLVLEVTDVSKLEDGNRKIRKQIDLKHLSKASEYGQTIKLADMISNTSSIVLRDPDFAKVYMVEKRNLLNVLTKGNKALYLVNKIFIDNYFK